MAAPVEARVRARAIFENSGNAATDKSITAQLGREGLGIYTPQTVGSWRRRHRWAEVSPRLKQVTALGEDLRQAVQVRTPDDLDRLERASLCMSATGERMAALGEKLADHVLSQIKNIKIETREDLETVIRAVETIAASTSDFVKSQLVVGKALQDLRLLRISSAFGPDGSRNGEVIPPERKEDRKDDGPRSVQEAVISNFA